MVSAKDIASLIEIRNYAAIVMQNTSVVKGTDYGKLGAKLTEIDKLLVSVILELDAKQVLVEPEPVPSTPKKKSRTAKSVRKIAKSEPPSEAQSVTLGGTPDLEKALIESVKELEEAANKEAEAVAPEKSEKNDKDLSDDEDLALIAQRVAEEKEKLKGKKSAAVIKKTVTEDV